MLLPGHFTVIPDDDANHPFFFVHFVEAGGGIEFIVKDRKVTSHPFDDIPIAQVYGFGNAVMVACALNEFVEKRRSKE